MVARAKSQGGRGVKKKLGGVKKIRRANEIGRLKRHVNKQCVSFNI